MLTRQGCSTMGLGQQPSSAPLMSNFSPRSVFVPGASSRGSASEDMGAGWPSFVSQDSMSGDASATHGMDLAFSSQLASRCHYTAKPLPGCSDYDDGLSPSFFVFHTEAGTPP